MHASAGPAQDGGWSNWSGSLRFKPSQIVRPRSEEEIVDLVRFARDTGRTLRPIGAGHSSTGILETDDIAVSLKDFAGTVSADPERGEITFRPGTVIEDATAEMLEHGLAPHNLGDINMQTVAGVVATGTHGTGRTLRNLSDWLIGGRIVMGTGEVLAFSAEREPDLLAALRLSLGALGIFTEMRIKALPAYRLRRQEWCAGIGPCLAHWEELAARNRNFDFYWYPRTDEAKLRILNPPGEGMTEIPWARPVEDSTDWAGKAIPKHGGIENRFDEMEYALPAEAAIACFRAVRERIRERHRRHVAWRLLVRTIAADEVCLSPASRRETVSISLHQNASLPFTRYFDDMEPVFRAHGGRPHWAKKHRLRAGGLKALYPMWDRFRDIRRRLDPDGLFLSPYLAELLGEEASG